MLITPLGDIEIYIDDKVVEYTEKCITVSGDLCPDVSGKYAIAVVFYPDGKLHTISCKIKGYTLSKEDEIESGERLELKSFYKGNTKLSIGMEGEAGYCFYGTRSSEIYDYDNDYMENGVSYLIREETKTTKYVFGVAWIENVTAENNWQTWYGADPTIF
ncbi:hypothetical protein OCV51_02830 [Faecalicatena acetigenes]|uniref:Uncharacterized protein n=1 Tax=Faecalicatena acetigenes TaxID=2981790 RepID=A0ABT2T9F2_9FIRM|nr:MULTISPECIES: hypothetical protein [Lachnospiraceae]MCU6746601.1 hypothetical protein [Faecalicatena acetigenes]SCH31541.1 Uncharacterised protein [uncultured Clostridium sp.]